MKVSSPTIASGSMTMTNLMDAYNRESNVRADYLAWAQKADQQGYHKVAELFRGAAKSEEIRIAHYAKNITKLGAMPAITGETPVVKDTSENLSAAIKEINYETGSLYPKYLVQSQTDNIPAGTMSFNSAIKIRGNQKTIFEKAVMNLESWKKTSGGFYVCTVCGNLTENLNFAKCEVCGAPLSEIMQVK
jgi:rubrerythrin